MVKKVLTWGGLAFLFFYLAYQPKAAAQVFKSLGGSVIQVATGLGSFLSSLVS
jgi:hypothetical protein